MRHSGKLFSGRVGGIPDTEDSESMQQLQCQRHLHVQFRYSCSIARACIENSMSRSYSPLQQARHVLMTLVIQLLVILAWCSCVSRDNIINLHNFINKIISPTLYLFSVYGSYCDHARYWLFGIRLGFRLIYPGSDYDWFVQVPIRISNDERLVRLAYGMD